MLNRNLRCRQCESYSRGRRSFFIPGAKPHYAPDLPFKLEHLKLDVKVDPRAKTLEGIAVQRLKVVAPEQKRVRLDQVGISIQEVKVDGKSASHSIEGNSLFVDLASSGKSPAPGDTIEISVQYRVHNSKRGLYFTGPDEFYPKKPHQVWSQGQDEDNRFWIPTFDYPNQKATTEIIATVPKGFTAVSNGALLAKTEQGEWTRFHYKLGTPHVTYLISLVVAEFEEWQDAGPRNLPVQYFVPPGRKEDGKRAFGNTPKMIRAFEEKVGVEYPYEKYSQVAVQDFIFGGMENTTSTTQTDRTLHDARAHLDFSSDPLVAHELAHQWFGDLLTCRDWSHGWLNEGFATFMERVWIESNVDEYGSADAAREEGKFYSFMDLQDHMEEDAKRYRRPIVCNTYVAPIDLFDTHLYQKGGLVLNLIRSVLGEDAFWKSIRHYVTRHRGGSVETLDLIRSIEETTGRNLRRLFDQWVFSAGFPEFELSYQWHEDKKLAELVIEQKQTQGKPELVNDGVVTPVFALPVTIELTVEGGKKIRQVIEISELRERVFLAAESKPLMVRFDPGNGIPKSLKFPRPKEMLIYQLTEDCDCMGRIEAAKELEKIADAEAVSALGKALKGDIFWGAQAEIAAVLGEIRTDQARDELISALKIPHPKARKAVVSALGRFRDNKTSASVRALAEKDPSYFVEAEATSSWTRSKLPPSLKPVSKDVDDVEAFLSAQLSKPSYLDVIRGAALRSLAELPGIERGERAGALEKLLDWVKRGGPEDARVAAIDALGKVAQRSIPAVRARILETFAFLAEEPSFRVRMRLISALGNADSTESVPILQRIQETDLDGRVRRDAMLLSDALVVSGSTPEAVSSLKTLIEKMEEEQRKLRSTVEELKAAKKA